MMRTDTREDRLHGSQSVQGNRSPRGHSGSSKKSRKCEQSGVGQRVESEIAATQGSGYVDLLWQLEEFLMIEGGNGVSCPQTPVEAWIVGTSPLRVTDQFDYSYEVMLKGKVEKCIENLGEGTFGIQLLGWRWHLDRSLQTVHILCSSFRIWKEQENFLIIDTVPPSIDTSLSIKHLLLDKIKSLQPEKAGQSRRKLSGGKSVCGGEVSTKAATSSQITKGMCTMAEKTPTKGGLSLNELLNTELDTKSCLGLNTASKKEKDNKSLSRGKSPSQRSRSRSLSKDSPEVISLSSDEDSNKTASQHRNSMMRRHPRHNLRNKKTRCRLLDILISRDHRDVRDLQIGSFASKTPTVIDLL